MRTIAAPAKVNLSLRILGKRDDGFHEVDLLMARVNLEDELEIRPSRSLSLTCDTPGVPTDESNLVLKAVREFEAAYGRTVNQHITLRKRIPHGAGLGGGSSDAATTLLALNDELGTQFDLAELTAMAARIGSDVPFFLNPVPSRCTGRGEIVTPTEKLAGWSSPIVLIKPHFGVSTAEAYKGIHSARRMKGLPYGTQKVDGIELINDLERPVFAKFPFLGLIKSWLLRQNGVRAAMMSGSGSTIFALTHTIEQAHLIAEAAKAELDATLFTFCGTVNEQAAPDTPAATQETNTTSPEQEPPALELDFEPEPLPAETAPAAAPAEKPHPGSSIPTCAAEAPTEPHPETKAFRALTKRRGRKPRIILEAIEAVEAARREAETLDQQLTATRQALIADGLDPDIKRRGRKPARLAEYAELQLAEQEARRKLQAAEYTLAKLEYERA